MNSRERVLKALAHREPDRVPIDLGGSLVTGINAAAYGRLKRTLGVEGDPPRASQEVVPDLVAAVALRRRRQDLQATQIARLGAALPLEQLRLPYHFGGELTSDVIGAFGDELLAGIGALPEQVLA